MPVKFCMRAQGHLWAPIEEAKIKHVVLARRLTCVSASRGGRRHAWPRAALLERNQNQSRGKRRGQCSVWAETGQVWVAQQPVGIRHGDIGGAVEQR